MGGGRARGQASPRRERAADQPFVESVNMKHVEFTGRRPHLTSNKPRIGIAHASNKAAETRSQNFSGRIDCPYFGKWCVVYFKFGPPGIGIGLGSVGGGNVWRKGRYTLLAGGGKDWRKGRNTLLAR